MGDVHGHWDHVIDAIGSAELELGRLPDVVLQVGDAEPYRNEADLSGSHVPSKYRSLGLFSALQHGDLTVLVFFIGGDHEPYPAFDTCRGPFPYEWSPRINAFYLGRAGAALLGNALNVAWIFRTGPAQFSSVRVSGLGSRFTKRTFVQACPHEAVRVQDRDSVPSQNVTLHILVLRGVEFGSMIGSDSRS
ncbi:MAG: metallophosphoesterase family protein [Acidimicrobiales bacterium]